MSTPSLEKLLKSRKTKSNTERITMDAIKDDKTIIVEFTGYENNQPMSRTTFEFFNHNQDLATLFYQYEFQIKKRTP